MKISKEAYIIGAIALVFIAIIGVLIWQSSSFVGNPQQVTNTALLANAKSHMTGKLGAKVTMVEFGDYQCPACAADYPVFKQIMETYKNNPEFNFVFRNFPLQQHKNALPAAEAAEAAGAQGKYWQMYDELYANQNFWAESKDPQTVFVTYATAIGLDVNKFKQAVASNAYQQNIEDDLTDVRALNLDHTPTVFLNGEEQTSIDFNTLKGKIDNLLNK